MSGGHELALRKPGSLETEMFETSLATEGFSYVRSLRCKTAIDKDVGPRDQA